MQRRILNITTSPAYTIHRRHFWAQRETPAMERRSPWSDYKLNAACQRRANDESASARAISHVNIRLEHQALVRVRRGLNGPLSPDAWVEIPPRNVHGCTILKGWNCDPQPCLRRYNCRRREISMVLVVWGVPFMRLCRYIPAKFLRTYCDFTMLAASRPLASQLRCKILFSRRRIS